MSENCLGCRFWQIGRDEKLLDGIGAHGWCRREPPKIIDHMARMAIRTPGFGGKAYDPEDVADVASVSEASLFPATYSMNWCGGFQERSL